MKEYFILPFSEQKRILLLFFFLFNSSYSPCQESSLIENVELTTEEGSLNFPKNDGPLSSRFRINYLQTKFGINVVITANELCRVNSIKIQLSQDLTSDQKILCNGFQTWSISEEKSLGERIPSPSPFIKPIIGYYGDYHLKKRSDKEYPLWSWSFTHLRLPSENENIQFIASLDEKSAFTLFKFHKNQNHILIHRDYNSHQLLAGDSIVIPLFIKKGPANEVWDLYSEQYLPTPIQPKPKMKGWNSWYYFYSSISEGNLLQELRKIDPTNKRFDLFQIDDGYQQACGDWLKFNNKFPNGLKKVVEKIVDTDLIPGIWVAPFVCVKSSDIFKNHPDWIVRDPEGKPIKVGMNLGWGGWYYALDIYNMEVQEYLRMVFKTLINDYGFRFIKLDFLFAVAIHPPRSISEGSCMHYAMKLLREWTQGAEILGCGVPLASAFGNTDYCRVGNDTHLSWDFNLLKNLNARERPSTLYTLLNTINRYPLNERFFLNDPDVFILRPNKNKLSQSEKESLFILNNLLGNMVMDSDPIGENNPFADSLLSSPIYKTTPAIQHINQEEGVIYIYFSLNEKEYLSVSNLSDEKRTVTLMGHLSSTVKSIELQKHKTLLFGVDENRRIPISISELGKE